MEATADNEVAGRETSPGGMLSAARQRLNLSVPDVARQLRLSARQIEALEADDFGKLPGHTFVRGFIRNYAKVVQLDSGTLLGMAEQMMPPQPAHSILPEAEDIPFSTGRDKTWRNYVLAGLVVALLPLLIYEAYREKTPQSAPVKQTSADIRPAAQSQIQSAAQAEAARAVPGKPFMGVPSGQDNLAQAGEQAAVNFPNSGENMIRMAFARDSWVEIRDRDGKTIFSQLNPGGTEQVIKGNPPFFLVIGNAAHVKLAYNEQPVDLTPHIKIEVARFTLN